MQQPCLEGIGRSSNCPPSKLFFGATNWPAAVGSTRRPPAHRLLPPRSSKVRLRLVQDSTNYPPTVGDVGGLARYPSSPFSQVLGRCMRLTINGQNHNIEAPADMPLLWVLRDLVGLTGTKFGCGAALCGACTVHIDGVATRSCVLPASAVVGKNITTIEAIGGTPLGKKLQDAWVAEDVPQCGYCQSGQIMSAAALLKGTPKPSDSDIDSAMNGNICRCGTYSRIRKAIHRATEA